MDGPLLLRLIGLQRAGWVGRISGCVSGIWSVKLLRHFVPDSRSGQCLDQSSCALAHRHSRLIALSNRTHKPAYANCAIWLTALRSKSRAFEFQAAFPDGFERQVYGRFFGIRKISD
jgi:hypothetical protein